MSTILVFKGGTSFSIKTLTQSKLQFRKVLRSTEFQNTFKVMLSSIRKNYSPMNMELDTEKKSLRENGEVGFKIIK